MEMKMFVDKGMIPGKGKDEMLFWNLTKDGTLQITGNGAMPDFNPDSGETIQTSPWYEYRQQIKKVVAEEGITVIGSNAFSGFEELTVLSLPLSLKRIGYCAFKGCKKLSEVQTKGIIRFIHLFDKTEEEHDEITIKMGTHAFSETPFASSYWGDFYISDGILFDYFGNDETVKIPAGISEIRTMAFEKCRVKYVELPEGLSVIYHFAFTQTALEKIEFPKSLKTVHHGAFSDIPGTLEILCPENRQDSISIDKYAFLDTKIHLTGKKKLPELYKLELKTADKIKGYKLMQIKRDNFAIGNIGFHAGNSILRRIERGAHVICITYDPVEEYVISIDCYEWNSEVHLPKCSRVSLYMRRTIGGISPAVQNIVEETIQMESFSERFRNDCAETLASGGQIRSISGQLKEEWYWCAGSETDAVMSGLKLLYQWMKVHENYHVKTVAESNES